MRLCLPKEIFTPWSGFDGIISSSVAQDKADLKMPKRRCTVVLFRPTRQLACWYACKSFLVMDTAGVAPKAGIFVFRC
jgi:hypothetical protein